MKVRIAMLVVVLVAAAASAEDDARLAAMKALPDLVGTWEGSGWMRRGPGEPMQSVGEERVESRLDGRVLVVEGKHYTPDRSRVVHHALAMLSWDSKTGDYRFDTALANEDGGSFRARMENGALIWENAHPERPARFIIRVEDGMWKEEGEIRIGGTWRKFFEMNLKKVK